MSLLATIRRSVRRKITALVLATMFIALLVNAAALLLYDVRAYREGLLSDLGTQAEILGRASAAAIAFNDRKDAQAGLATLAARPDVELAALYGSDGRLFTLFAREAGAEAGVPSLAPPPGQRADVQRAVVVHRITEMDDTVGSVYLQARSGLRERVLGYLGILALVMLVALLAGYALSAGLQRVVTEPILGVTEAAREVVEKRDFSVRAAATTEDETRVLADAFNEMLAEVERRAAALRTADRRKDEFLATLAHELRNPLAPIRTALYLVETEPGNAQVMAEARAVIDRQIRQMVRLIDDLMDVSRIATAKLELQKERVALRAIGEQALEAARPLLDARGHRVDVRLPESDVTVEVDPVRLGQVFLNLLNNAAKFTDPGGRVAFKIERIGGGLLARVRDSGRGIAPDMLENIFGMFFQADRSLERDTMGLGVGLALSRRIVELHGGTIEARSAGPGRGSEFIVRLPEAGVQVVGPAAAGAEAGGRPAERARRILLADDNRDFADGLAALLRRLGNEVRVTHDGATALAAAGEFRPDVAFLDIGLPKLNGLDLARRLRALPATASSLLVAVSGWGQPADRARAKEAGFDRYLVKPVDPRSIEAVLAQPR